MSELKFKEPGLPTTPKRAWSRFRLYCRGPVLLGVRTVFPYFSHEREVLRTAAFVGVGLLLVWLGLKSFEETVANLECWLPLFILN